MDIHATLPAEKLYSDREVAKRLGVATSTVLRLRQSKQLAFYRVGGRVMISEEHIRTFLAQCESKATKAVA